MARFEAFMNAFLLPNASNNYINVAQNNGPLNLLFQFHFHLFCYELKVQVYNQVSTVQF